MKNNTPFRIHYWMSVLIVGLFVGMGLQIASAQWQEPTSPPPEGNVPGPLTTGSENQTKSGGMILGGDLLVTANIGGFNLVGNSLRGKKVLSNEYCLYGEAGSDGPLDCVRAWPGKVIEVKKSYEGNPDDNDKEGALFCPDGYEAVSCQNYREEPVIMSYPFGGVKFAFKAMHTDDYPRMFSPGGCVASYCGADDSYKCTAVALCQRK